LAPNFVGIQWFDDNVVIVVEDVAVVVLVADGTH